MYARFVVDDIPLRGLERGNGNHPLGLVLVGSLTDELLEHELVAHPLRHERRIVESHHDESTHLVVSLRGESYLRCGGEVVGGCLLQEHVGHIEEVYGIRPVFVVVDAVSAERRGHAEHLLVVGLPLPLQSCGGSRELIALHGVHHLPCHPCLGFAVGHHRFTTVVTVVVHPHHGPIVAPCHGLQVYHPAIAFLVLEMKEPVLPHSSVHPSPLVRAVDIGVTLCQHLLRLIRPVRSLGTHGELEARGHSPCRAHDPVPPLPLVELRSLTGAVLRAVAVEDNDGLRYRFCSLRIEFTHGDYRGEPRAAVCPSVHQVATAVVVPKRASVYHPFPRNDAERLRPFPCRVFGLHHEHPIIRVTPVDIEFPVVVSDARSPDAIAVAWCVEHLAGLKFLHGISDDFPVYQIPGVEYGQSGDALEGTGSEVIVVAHHTHVGVAVIRIDDGVGVSAVAIVGRPHLRVVVLLSRNCHEECREAHEEHFSHLIMFLSRLYT